MVEVKHISAGITEFFDRMDRLYPNRHKEIHKVPCKDCPSTMPIDPMEQEYDDYIKSLPKETIAKEHLFVCGWRGSKLCKGYCDSMNIEQTFLNELYK